jgi:hypothetical protein
MEPEQLLKTVYLGDRACKSILIDGWSERVVLTVDVISRIRSTTGQWDFYADEDVENGMIVFSQVQSMEFDPPGYIPHDFISFLSVRGSEMDPEGNRIYLFVASIGGSRSQMDSREVTLRIKAGGVHLEDPRFPGKEIRD